MIYFFFVLKRKGNKFVSRARACERGVVYINDIHCLVKRLPWFPAVICL